MSLRKEMISGGKVSNKKRGMGYTVKMPDHNGLTGRLRHIYTARGEWYRRFRLCRVFGLDPMKPIN